jgi:hypothetical protein
MHIVGRFVLSVPQTKKQTSRAFFVIKMPSQKTKNKLKNKNWVVDL